MNRKLSPSQPAWTLEILLNALPIRVFWKDRESKYLGCNDLFAMDAGLDSADDVAGKTDYDMPWKEQAASYRGDDLKVMSTGEPKLGYETPQTMPDGSLMQTRRNKVPLRDGQGRIIGVMGIYEDITEHKNAEEQLREREALYRTMFESSPFSVALANLNGEITDVNQRFEDITGIPRDEAIGRTPIQLGLMDRTTQIAALEEIGRTGGRLDGYEVSVITRRGETKCALLSTALVSLKDEPLILAIINDITERREAEEALRKSEEKYRELVQNANSIILRWGRDGIVHFFNEFAQSFFGYSEEEIVGRSVLGTIVPETETSGRDLQAMIAEITAHPEYHGTNVNENMRKNGERVWIAWTNKPVFDDAGEIAEILSVGLDISARIRDQQVIQESEARYRSIFSSNVDAFLLLDTDGKIADANARAAELFGYSKDELVTLTDCDIVDSETCHLLTAFDATSLGEWFQREVVAIGKDGRKFSVEVHGSRLNYGGRERLLAIVFDVTERNKAREYMQLFTNVAHNMQVSLYIYHLEDPKDDRTLRLTAANPAALAWLGKSEAEAVGRYIDELLPDLRQHGVPQQFADVVRTGEPCSLDDFLYGASDDEPRSVAIRAFSIPGDLVGVLVEDITELMQAEEDKRRFYRKTIEAATQGKLIICDYDEIRQIIGPPVATYEITGPEQVSMVRKAVTQIAESSGMDEAKVSDLAVCVGEALANVVKHVGQGKVSVHQRDGALLIPVEDHGPGMEAINLPDVALTRGYTTSVSLGMGYKAMISLADQVYLATGPEGTTVAIEMGLQPTTKPSIAELPDTW